MKNKELILRTLEVGGDISFTMKGCLASDMEEVFMMANENNTIEIRDLSLLGQANIDAIFHAANVQGFRLKYVD